MSSGFTWRFSLAFGAFPVLIAFPWRLRMHETETFERVLQNRRDLTSFMSYATLPAGQSHDNVGSNKSLPTYGATSQPSVISPTAEGSRRASYSDYNIGTSPYNSNVNTYDTESSSLIHPQSPTPTPGVSTKPITFSRTAELQRAWMFYKWHILGTATSWFLLDVVFYANGLFNHDVTSLILSPGKHTTSLQDARNSFLLCLMVSVFVYNSICHTVYTAYVCCMSIYSVIIIYVCTLCTYINYIPI